MQHHSHRQPRKQPGLTSALAMAIAAVTTTLAQPAIAQQELEEITVTGSRVRQTSGFETPTPVTTMTPTELFDFEPGNTVVEQLDALPQFFGNTSLQSVSTGQASTSGTTSLNLRNLGGNRTLVLLDGIRVVPAAKDGLVNADTFPAALIRSVDVVTGGASAAYGADAVGGVVNFILNREFEGMTMSASTGITEQGDGELWNLSVAGGRAFLDGRLNLIGSLEARKIDQVNRHADEVPEMQRWGYVTNPAWNPNDPPGTHPRQITLPMVTSTASSPYGLITGTGTVLDRMRFTPDGSNITPFVLGDISSVSGPGSTQSTSGGPDALLSNNAFGGGIGGTGAENRTGFFAAQYRFSDNFSVFGQAMVGRTEATNVSDRGGALLYSIWAPQIAIDNAYLPDNVRQIMADNGLEQISVHKNGAFAGDREPGYGRTDSKIITTTSYSAGFDWDLGFRDWNLHGVWQEGESKRRSEFGQLWRVDRAFLAMDAVRDPETGAIVCRVQLYDPTPEQLANSPAVQGRISSRSAPGAINPGDPGAIPLRSPIGLDNTVRDCVPFNVLGAGNMSQEALDYVNGDPKIGAGEVDQTFSELLLTGELFSGWGYGAINFATGLTWREQSFWDDAFPIAVDELGPPRNDPALGIRGIPVGYANGGASLHYISTLPVISGDASVWEAFGEVNIPIWSGSIGNQEQSLSTDLAFRRSDYERSGGVNSWKAGFNIQVLSDVRLRFTKSRDVREPTFAELFDAQGTNGVILDPRFNDSEFQISKIQGGNPNLAPEEANTLTAGIVYTPSFGALDGMQLSVDWYDVKIRGAVGSLGEQRIVDGCFNDNVPSLCAQIEMSANDIVTRVHDTFQNVAQARVQGVDFEAAYRIEPNFFDSHSESLSIRGLAGYLSERSDTPLDGTPLDRAGSMGSPDLTAVLTTNYRVGPLSFMLQGRFINSVIRNNLWVEGIDVDDNTVPSITWWNAGLHYNGETNSGATWRVGLNIQNLLDKAPVVVPSVSTRFAIQSFTGDTYGRRYNLNVNYSF